MDKFEQRPFTRATFNSASKFDDDMQSTISNKPRMIKYQVRKGHSGLGGRLVRVSEIETPKIQSLFPEKLEEALNVGRATSYESQRSHINKSKRILPQSYFRKKLSSQDLAQEQSMTQRQEQTKPTTANINMADLSKNLKRPNLPKVNKKQLDVKTQEDLKPETILPNSPQSCNLIRKTPKNFQFIDQIPLDDPIWRTIIPEEVYINPNFDVVRIISENYEYFQHQLGICVCFRCQCGQCKCDFALSKQVRFNFSMTQPSVYGQDFKVKINGYNNINPLNQLTYNTKYNDNETIDFNSIQRTSYKLFAITPNERYKEQTPLKSTEFTSTSSYQSNYNTYNNPQPHFFKRPIHLSTSDQIPFKGESLYQGTYCKDGKGKPAELLKYQSQLSTLPMTVQYINSSQNTQTYKPFKIHQKDDIGGEGIKVQKVVLHSHDSDFIALPAFEGQFKSLKNRDFQGQHHNICPGQEFKKQLQQRLTQKQNLFQQQLL